MPAPVAKAARRLVVWCLFAWLVLNQQFDAAGESVGTAAMGVLASLVGALRRSR